jgi:hypothetical protein
MNIRLLLNRWVILGAVVLAGLLTLITAISIGLTSARQSEEVGFIPADLTMISAPTSTSSAPATATIDPFAPTATPTGIAIGNYVQISGTEGEGLRIRSEPGLNGAPQFLGYDEEVFIVQDGPREADGFIWWYLVAPYDQTRVGWAAADFLSFIPAP